MSLDTFTTSNTNQRLATGDTQALIIERFNKKVEQVLKKSCATEGLMSQFEFVQGTGTFTKKALGRSQLQKLVRGVTPNGSPLEVNKISVTIETPIMARNIIALIDKWQTDWDYQSKIAEQQATDFAEFIDNTNLITMLKAAKETTSKYGVTGFQGGTQVTMPTASKKDPTALLDAIRRLMAGMEQKNVYAARDAVELYVPSEVFWDMAGSDLLVNGEFKTADATSFASGQRAVLKAYGLVVNSTNNSPLGVQVTDHLLNTTDNGNFYNVDGRNDLILAASPKAIWGVRHADVYSDMFNDKLSVSDYIDSFCGFATTVDRAEYAGVVSLV